MIWCTVSEPRTGYLKNGPSIIWFPIFKAFPHAGPNTPFSAYAATTAHKWTVTARIVASNSHSETLTTHIRTVTAHAVTVTAHIHPFEPTATTYEKWRSHFCYCLNKITN